MDYPKIRKANPKRKIYQILRNDSVSASDFQKEKKRDRMFGYLAYLMGAVTGLAILGIIVLILRLL